jgi:signal transduction histidine kinase/CheY-like chemotaxis protein
MATDPQDHALSRALDELQRKQQELERLSHELEDTNRGVVALYAELDEKAAHLRRADEMKSRFLSNMTHEFRTPVNAILGLCNLLAEDRALEGREPQPEVAYIRQSAEQLSALVNDLLDIAKVEAGKTVVRPAVFEPQNLLGALRGTLRPTLLSESVALVFDDVREMPSMYQDEGKISQILRNLISNALKFTEHGEVRVSAHANAADGTVTFSVADTGIGIAAEDQARIFEEFAQVEHRLQRRMHGTGLGLPLSRRLAELLGGRLALASEPGAGSTFSVTLPARYEARQQARTPFEWTPDPARLPLLIVEDAHDAQFVYEKMLRTSPFQVYPAYSVTQALEALDTIAPAAIVMDLVLAGAEAWDLLITLKRDDRTRDVPVVMVSALDNREKGLALGADAYLVKPVERQTLIDTLTAVRAPTAAPVRVLTIDDEDVARFLMRQCLPSPAFEVTEAATAQDGLRCARDQRPDVILLDLIMPDVSGWDVLAQLRADPVTCRIPVVIATGAALDDDESRRLLLDATAILPKAELSRHTVPRAVRQALNRGI